MAVSGKPTVLRTFAERLMLTRKEVEERFGSAAGIDFKTSRLLPPSTLVIADDDYIFYGNDMGFGSKVASPEESGLCVGCGRPIAEPGICKGCRENVEREAQRAMQQPAPPKYTKKKVRATTGADLDEVLRNVYAAPLIDEVRAQMRAAEIQRLLDDEQRQAADDAVLRGVVNGMYGPGYYEATRGAAPKPAAAPPEKPKFVEKPRGRRISLTDD